VPAGTIWEVLSVSQAQNPEDTRYRIVLCGAGGEALARQPTYDGCWYGLLRPAHAIPRWTDAFSSAAQAQGWDIFDISGSVRPERLDLENIDADPRFNSAEETWEFVWRQAEAGDPVATQALLVISVRAPDEYEHIRRHMQKQLGKSLPPLSLTADKLLETLQQHKPVATAPVYVELPGQERQRVVNVRTAADTMENQYCIVLTTSPNP
jgi:hypothetical protein